MSTVVIGIVTDNKDPNGLGRLKVKFPLMQTEGAAKVKSSPTQAEEDTAIESDWIRMTSFFAGNQRGAFFLPQINDEVLITFAYGNVNMPYVIGALWNGKDIPPVPKAEQQQQCEIKTVSGNTILFDDTKDKNKITITDAKQNQIVIDTSSGTITISANQDIAVSAQKGNITVTAAKDLNINASGQATIKASQINIEATSSLKLKGSMIDIN